MDIKIENIVNVWDDKIPMMLIDLVNTLVFTRDESELRTAVEQVANKTEDFNKFFAYGYGSHHFWLHQRLTSDESKMADYRLLSVHF